MKKQVKKVDIYIMGDYYYSAWSSQSLPKLKAHLIELWSRNADLNNNVERFASSKPNSITLKINKGA
jgi:hypothetical protein